MMFGIHGRAGAGKDTVGRFIHDMVGYQPLSFGAEIYREVADAFGVTIEFLGDRHNKETPMPELSLVNCVDNVFLNLMLKRFANETDILTKALSPRWVLQNWGTEYRRAEDPDYWIKKAAPKLRDRTTWTDVRVEKEASLLRMFGAPIIIVTKPGLGDVRGHSTEMGIEPHPTDIHVVNDGSLEDLEIKVRMVLMDRGLIQGAPATQRLSV